jgi:hypothetical protein
MVTCADGLEYVQALHAELCEGLGVRALGSCLAAAQQEPGLHTLTLNISIFLFEKTQNFTNLSFADACSEIVKKFLKFLIYPITGYIYLLTYLLF